MNTNAPPPDPEIPPHAAAGIDTLAERRERLQAMASARRERLAALEARILERLDNAARALATARQESEARHEEVGREAAEVERRTAEVVDRESQLSARASSIERQAAEAAAAGAELAERGSALDAREMSVDERRQAITSQQSELDAGQAALDARRKELTAQQKEITARQAELDARQKQLDAVHADLEARQSSVAAQQTELAAREQRLAAVEAQLRREEDRIHNEEETSLAAARATAEEQSHLKQLAAERRTQCEREAEELDAERERTMAQRRRIAERLRFEHEELLEERRRLKEAAETAASAAAEAHAADTAAETQAFEARHAQEIAAITAERDALRRRLAEAEDSIEAARHIPADVDEDRDRELADLSQRYEMAVRDIRELKKQNEELSKASRGRAPSTPGEPMDWEARKRQILASLEEDDGDEHAPTPEERRQIEDVVRSTDAALADKQREIEELKEMLATRAPEATAGSQAAAPEMSAADTDEIILQQRERLKELEREWEGKLRQAEIEMSVKRAQLARAAAELEEKQRAFDELRSNQPASQHQNDADTKDKKPTRGRWLSRLGLNEDDS